MRASLCKRREGESYNDRPIPADEGNQSCRIICRTSFNFFDCFDSHPVLSCSCHTPGFGCVSDTGSIGAALRITFLPCVSRPWCDGSTCICWRECRPRCFGRAFGGLSSLVSCRSIRRWFHLKNKIGNEESRFSSSLIGCADVIGNNLCDWCALASIISGDWHC